MATSVLKANTNDSIRNRMSAATNRRQGLLSSKSNMKAFSQSSSLDDLTKETTISVQHSLIVNDDDNVNDILTNHENILFVCLDTHSKFPSNAISSFQAINDHVENFTDSDDCLALLQSSNDLIFFISSFADKQYIEEVHNLDAVQAIFILNSAGHVDNRFPKLFGTYMNFEKMLASIRNILDWFEKTQMEQFMFESSDVFIWSQLWKEEFSRPTEFRSSSTKEKFIKVAEDYYHDNKKLLQSINEFKQSYTKTNTLLWCFHYPVPSRFLHRALRTRHTEHLNACRFILSDASQMIKQLSKEHSTSMLYKRMKITHKLLRKLENHVGKLICAKGFFICGQTRQTALSITGSLDHRSDLLPVLFKISYDTTVPIATVQMKNTTPFVVFDVYTPFRVIYVNRRPVSIIKLEPAYEDGRRLGIEYRSQHEGESIQNLLTHLLIPPKLAVQEVPSEEQPTPVQSINPNTTSDNANPPIIVADEKQAEEHINRGEIDQGLAIYKQIKPESARIYNTIGGLYSEKKGDFNSAIIYYKKALEIQEKNGGDISEILTNIGNAHQHRREFDIALAHHQRALNLRKTATTIDPKAVASSLVGISSAYWGQQKLSEALDYAQQALTMNESVQPGNDLNIAINLSALANIHHSMGDPEQAVEIATQAVICLEKCASQDSYLLSSLLNNLGTIQVAAGLFLDARENYIEALEIGRKILPNGHPRLISMEINIQRLNELEKKQKENSQIQS